MMPILSVLCVLSLLLTSSAQAHVRWFASEGGEALRWNLFFQPLPLTFVALVLLATGVAYALWRARAGRDFLPPVERLGALPERRALLYGLIPLILGVHVAVPLIVAAVQSDYFTPNNHLSSGPGSIFGLLLTFVALAFFYGGFTRVAAGLLALLWLAGIPLAGLTATLENIHFLGFAAFFFLAGRGPISIDRLLFQRLEPPERFMRRAVPVLRFFLGLNIVILAFTEKFAALPLAQNFLERYPLNFTSALGLPIPDTTFILIAGSVELLLGLWLMLGIFPREVILVAWMPFNLTLTQFNWIELVGHLPIYGAMAVLLIWEGTPLGIQRWIAGLRSGSLPIKDVDVAREQAEGEAGMRGIGD